MKNYKKFDINKIYIGTNQTRSHFFKRETKSHLTIF